MEKNILVCILMSNETFNFPAVLESQGIKTSDFTNRQKVEIIEYWLGKVFENIADELPVDHYLYPGHYARSLFIPAGTILTGKIHKLPGVFVLVYGDLSVMGDSGMVRAKGPFSMRYGAGIKRAGYAHSDTLCITFHRTNAQTVADAEAELFEDSDLSWVESIGMEFPKQLAA